MMNIELDPERYWNEIFSKWFKFLEEKWNEETQATILMNTSSSVCEKTKLNLEYVGETFFVWKSWIKNFRSDFIIPKWERYGGLKFSFFQKPSFAGQNLNYQK